MVGIDRSACTSHGGLVVDIVQKAQTVESIVAVAPDVVVHTAAETNVDRCETERDLAWKINVDGTASVVEGCVRAGAKLVLMSTDYVFDGAKGDYGEADEPKPINFYGLTKLEAERITASALPGSLIVRTSVLYGWHPTKLNFATWILKALRERQRTKVAVDHINSPTLADNLARAVSTGIQRGSQGVLHVAGSERISRFDFALRIAKFFNLDNSLLTPVEMKDLDWIAKRPRDSSLSVAKAQKELGIELLGADRGVQEMARNQP